MDFCFWVVEYSRGFFYVWNLKEVCQVGEVSGSSSVIFIFCFWRLLEWSLCTIDLLAVTKDGFFSLQLSYKNVAVLSVEQVLGSSTSAHVDAMWNNRLG